MVGTGTKTRATHIFVPLAVPVLELARRQLGAGQVQERLDLQQHLGHVLGGREVFVLQRSRACSGG